MVGGRDELDISLFTILLGRVQPRPQEPVAFSFLHIFSFPLTSRIRLFTLSPFWKIHGPHTWLDVSFARCYRQGGVSIMIPRILVMAK
jgi:hypothetical protein